MSIEIKRIYLENYKLFTLKEIVFSNQLCVFDGPNGYGKTSIFDAIELLITGTISRIKDSEVVAANLSYEKNCLANNPQKAIRIKGEFRDSITNQIITIALCLSKCSNAGRHNNPKNIEAQTKSYLLDSYDTPVEDWKKYLVTSENMKLKRMDFFGEKNLDLFQMLHYVHQEDRLAFFKQSENNRVQSITELFGIKEEQSKLEKIKQVQRNLSSRLSKLKEQIDEIEMEIKLLPERTDADVAYESLVGGNVIWDKEDLGFKGKQSANLYEQFKQEIGNTRAFLENKKWYFISTAIDQFEKIDISKREAALRGWFIKQSSEVLFDTLKKRNDELIFLTKQTELLSSNKFNNVDWKQLCDVLDCNELLDTITECVRSLNQAQKNQTETVKLINSFYQAREMLARRKEEIDSVKNGVCPYCGYQWDSDKKLQEQYAKTELELKKILGSGNEIYNDVLQRCRKIYDSELKDKIVASITLINKYEGIQLLSQFNDYKEFCFAVECCNPILEQLKLFTGDLKMSFEHLDSIETLILEMKESIPFNYNALAMEHKFDKIYKEYFLNNNYLNVVTVEKLKRKIQYIEDQYYKSFNQMRQNLIVLRQQYDKLEPLCKKIKIYQEALDTSIDSYQELVIKQIEIPFFLYCSRLLQSYQGGQGVVITNKDGKIRFTAPGGEHDITYTMSSGQLSAVLLAFSLVLNKMYSGRKFKTLFIDDPIQCMDDINMISFVELLRREFSESQIFLSTHEDTFANYIKYKFSKYNIKSQAITLKNNK